MYGRRDGNQKNRSSARRRQEEEAAAAARRRRRRRHERRWTRCRARTKSVERPVRPLLLMQRGPPRLIYCLIRRTRERASERARGRERLLLSSTLSARIDSDERALLGGCAPPRCSASRRGINAPRAEFLGYLARERGSRWRNSAARTPTGRPTFAPRETERGAGGRRGVAVTRAQSREIVPGDAAARLFCPHRVRSYARGLLRARPGLLKAQLLFR